VTVVHVVVGTCTVTRPYVKRVTLVVTLAVTQTCAAGGKRLSDITEEQVLADAATASTGIVPPRPLATLAYVALLLTQV
jgi:hypothetical protein